MDPQQFWQMILTTIVTLAPVLGALWIAMQKLTSRFLEREQQMSERVEQIMTNQAEKTAELYEAHTARMQELVDRYHEAATSMRATLEEVLRHMEHLDLPSE